MNYKSMSSLDPPRKRVLFTVAYSLCNSSFKNRLTDWFITLSKSDIALAGLHADIFVSHLMSSCWLFFKINWQILRSIYDLYFLHVSLPPLIRSPGVWMGPSVKFISTDVFFSPPPNPLPTSSIWILEMQNKGVQKTSLWLEYIQMHGVSNHYLSQSTWVLAL